MNIKRLILSVLLIVAMIASGASAAFAGENTGAGSDAQGIEQSIRSTGDYLMETVQNPTISTVGGEWTIIGLARSQKYVPQSYYDTYYANVVTELKEKNGHLTSTKYTEYSRLILALTAINKDVRNVGGYNLLEKLADFNSVKKQGINGPIYALIALDSNHYAIPQVNGVSVQTTRQMLIDYILSKEVVEKSGKRGGFSLSGESADPDITGMALQALANYRDQAKVKEVIARALTVLEGMELSSGGYSTWGGENSESIIQVIIAKTMLGIDPAENVSALKDYYVSPKGFRHIPNGDLDLMATEQGMYALSAYARWLNSENLLYQMQDNALIKVALDGEYLRFDQPPVNIDGRVLVPMRVIFEAMGADVQWDGSKQKVAAVLGNKKIELFIGDTSAYLNGAKHTLDVPARIINGRTMVPVRFVSESLEAAVNWEQGSKSVVIKTN